MAFSPFSDLYFLQPVLSSHPVLSGHLAIPQGWPLNTGSTVYPGVQMGTAEAVSE